MKYSAFGELEPFSGARLTGFLTFLFTGIAGQHSAGFQIRTKGFVVFQQSAGNTVAQSTCLSGNTAADDVGNDVQTGGETRQREGLKDVSAGGFGGEIFFKPLPLTLILPEPETIRTLALAVFLRPMAQNSLTDAFIQTSP